jgi:predicted DNA binding CopG/RHH family protein
MLTRRSCSSPSNAANGSPPRVASASGARYSRYAKATFRKDRRLNIRLSSQDLEAIQKRALAEGLPYQTLISSLLHKYAAGRLKEI